MNNDNSNIELDKIEELTYLIDQIRNSLHYIEEFNLNVDRESKTVEVRAKFQL